MIKNNYKIALYLLLLIFVSCKTVKSQEVIKFEYAANVFTAFNKNESISMAKYDGKLVEIGNFVVRFKENVGKFLLVARDITKYQFLIANVSAKDYYKIKEHYIEHTILKTLQNI